MDRELALRWAEALESGEYRQRTGALCSKRGDDPKEYCCLGVLAELHGRLQEINDVREDALRIKIFGIFDRGDTERLHPNSGGYSRDTLEFFGMELREADKWVRWNDILGRSFAQIAREIRRDYLAED